MDSPAIANDAKNKYRRGSAWKETERGPLFLEFEVYKVTALRPTPARAWVTARNAGSRWFGTREPNIDVAALIREVRADALVPSHEQDVVSPVVAWRRTNFRRFLEQVEPEVRDLVAEGWAGSTWPLFRLLQSSPDARELCASNNDGRA